MEKKQIAVLLSLVVLASVFMGGYMVLADSEENPPYNEFEGRQLYGRQHQKGLWLSLTEEQRTELQEFRSEIEEFRNAGATREEIREMLADKLEEMGIDLPICDGSRLGSQHGGFNRRYCGRGITGRRSAECPN